jgi:hypothetical protein
MKLTPRRWILVLVLFATVCTRPTAAGDPDINGPDELRERIEKVLAATQRRYLNVQQHTPWQIFHGILAFGMEFQILDEQGQLVPAVEYICTRARVNGQRWFVPTPYGLEPDPIRNWEGHPNQLLAKLAISGVPLDYPIIVDGWRYQLHHLVTQAQYDYYVGQEASWTLIALSTYLDPHVRWRNRYGDAVNLEGIVRYEVQLDVESAPCGGTHNLYALGHALRQHRRKSPTQTLAGVWADAEAKLARYARLTRSYQNHDGSFSAGFYGYRRQSSDPETVLNSTGHTLEWLMVYLGDDEIKAEWIRRAAEALVRHFEATLDRPLRCGPLYHGAHALRLYHSRRYQIPPVLAQETLHQLPHASAAVVRPRGSPKRSGPRRFLGGLDSAAEIDLTPTTALRELSKTAPAACLLSEEPDTLSCRRIFVDHGLPLRSKAAPVRMGEERQRAGLLPA